MTEKELNGIVSLKNESAIKKAISSAGFSDMKLHPTLKKASLVPVLQSKNNIKTDWIYNGKFSYNLAYFYGVEGYENYEFIFLQIDVNKEKYSVLVPHFWGIYYKETPRN